MHHRINVTLPEETVRLIDRVVKKGDRSRFIDKAVKTYVRGLSRADLRKKLKEEATAWADYDLKVAAEWFPLDEEAWQRDAE